MTDEEIKKALDEATVKWMREIWDSFWKDAERPFYRALKLKRSEWDKFWEEVWQQRKGDNHPQ